MKKHIRDKIGVETRAQKQKRLAQTPQARVLSHNGLLPIILSFVGASQIVEFKMHTVTKAWPKATCHRQVWETVDLSSCSLEHIHPLLLHVSRCMEKYPLLVPNLFVERQEPKVNSEIVNAIGSLCASLRTTKSLGKVFLRKCSLAYDWPLRYFLDFIAKRCQLLDITGSTPSNQLLFETTTNSSRFIAPNGTQKGVCGETLCQCPSRVATCDLCEKQTNESRCKVPKSDKCLSFLRFCSQCCKNICSNCDAWTCPSNKCVSLQYLCPMCRLNEDPTCCKCGLELCSYCLFDCSRCHMDFCDACFELDHDRKKRVLTLWQHEQLRRDFVGKKEYCMSCRLAILEQL
jgi:hypothetical protein